MTARPSSEAHLTVAERGCWRVLMRARQTRSRSRAGWVAGRSSAGALASFAEGEAGRNERDYAVLEAAAGAGRVEVGSV